MPYFTIKKNKNIGIRRTLGGVGRRGAGGCTTAKIPVLTQPGPQAATTHPCITHY